MAQTKRRARGEDSIYYDRSRDRWTGTISVGWKADRRRDRIIVRGRTKTEVKAKLRAKHQELAAGEGRDGVEGEQPGVLHEPRRPDVRD